MRFSPTAVPGVVVVDPEPVHDERGSFARTWDPDEFAAHGLDPRIAQISVSANALRGTLRGMHLQVEPHAEAKLVRCTAGAVLDVAVDLRPGSPTLTQWVGVELSATNRTALYVPPGCAHGFLTLTDGAEVLYQISVGHAPQVARGYRYDDPAFGIDWPAEPSVISERDRGWPAFPA